MVGKRWGKNLGLWVSRNVLAGDETDTPEVAAARTEVVAALPTLDDYAARLVAEKTGLHAGRPSHLIVSRQEWTDRFFRKQQELVRAAAPGASLSWRKRAAAAMSPRRGVGRLLTSEAGTVFTSVVSSHVALETWEPGASPGDPLLYLDENIAREALPLGLSPVDLALSIAIHGAVHRGQSTLTNFSRAVMAVTGARFRHPSRENVDGYAAIMAVAEGQAMNVQQTIGAELGLPVQPFFQTIEQSDAPVHAPVKHGHPFMAEAVSVLGGAVPLNRAMDSGVLPTWPEITNRDVAGWARRVPRTAR